MNINIIKPNKENLNTFVGIGSFFVLLGFIDFFANTFLNKFVAVSKASDALTSEGSTNFYKNVVNDYYDTKFYFDANLEDSGGGATLTLNSAFNTLAYTKIGRLVHVAADVRISSVSSRNGTTLISLPFTALNNSKATSSNSMMTGGVTYQTSQDGPFFTRSLANTTTAEVLYDTNGNF